MDLSPLRRKPKAQVIHYPYRAPRDFRGLQDMGVWLGFLALIIATIALVITATR